jgi:hypothetical protein
MLELQAHLRTLQQGAAAGTRRTPASAPTSARSAPAAWTACWRNVCPNCGGGFVPRPVRPVHNWKGDNYLGKDPART